MVEFSFLELAFPFVATDPGLSIFSVEAFRLAARRQTKTIFQFSFIAFQKHNRTGFCNVCRFFSRPEEKELNFMPIKCGEKIYREARAARRDVPSQQLLTRHENCPVGIPV